tara:strand:+ start:77 stop:247 length:171 start_codon:yes stop_codon:yes gene_type:complete
LALTKINFKNYPLASQTVIVNTAIPSFESTRSNAKDNGSQKSEAEAPINAILIQNL